MWQTTLGSTPSIASSVSIAHYMQLFEPSIDCQSLHAGGVTYTDIAAATRPYDLAVPWGDAYITGRPPHAPYLTQETSDTMYLSALL